MKRSGHREYGQAVFSPLPGGTLFRGLPPRSRVWMSHGDDVRRAPAGLPRRSGRRRRTRSPPIEDPQRRLYGMQFHPEVVHSEEGAEGPRELPSTSAAAGGTGTRARSSRRRPSACASRSGEGPRRLRAVGRRRLGGGGAAPPPGDRRPPHLRVRGQRPAAQGRGGAGRAPIRASGSTSRCVTVDASRRFLAKLAGVSDPERKRKIIGREFIEVFKASMRKVGQGRLPRAGHALPRRDRVGLGARPLGGDQEPPQRRRAAEGDEVQARRAAAVAVQGRGAQGRARARASTRSSSYRQPFPGPGLAVRCLGAGDEGAARPAARGRRHLHRGDQGARASTASSGRRSPSSCPCARSA